MQWSLTGLLACFQPGQNHELHLFEGESRADSISMGLTYQRNTSRDALLKIDAVDNVCFDFVVKHKVWFLDPVFPKSGYPLGRVLSKVKLSNMSKSTVNSKPGRARFWFIPNIGTLPKSLGYLPVISTIPGEETYYV